MQQIFRVRGNAARRWESFLLDRNLQVSNNVRLRASAFVFVFVNDRFGSEAVRSENGGFRPEADIRNGAVPLAIGNKKPAEAGLFEASRD